MWQHDATYFGLEGLVREELERIVDDAGIWKRREL